MHLILRKCKLFTIDNKFSLTIGRQNYTKKAMKIIAEVGNTALDKLMYCVSNSQGYDLGTLLS